VAAISRLAGGPNQDVGIPYRRQAMLGRAFDPHGHAAGAKVDRHRALALGQREKRVGHQVLRVARRQLAGKRMKQFELLALRVVPDGHQ